MCLKQAWAKCSADAPMWYPFLFGKIIFCIIFYAKYYTLHYFDMTSNTYFEYMCQKYCPSLLIFISVLLILEIHIVIHGIIMRVIGSSYITFFSGIVSTAHRSALRCFWMLLAIPADLPLYQCMYWAQGSQMSKPNCHLVNCLLN